MVRRGMMATSPLDTARQSDEGMADQQDNKGRFIKGNKANPIGAKAHDTKARKGKVIDWCKRHTLEGMKIALRIARDSEASNGDKLKAIGMIAERGYGRPEAAQSATQGMFQGATIIVDTGIRRRALEPSTIDETGRVEGQDGDKSD